MAVIRDGKNLRLGRAAAGSRLKPYLLGPHHHLDWSIRRRQSKLQSPQRTGRETSRDEAGQQHGLAHELRQSRVRRLAIQYFGRRDLSQDAVAQYGDLPTH